MKTVLTASLILLAGCSAMTLTPSDFSWPVESELTAGRDGMVNEERYHLRFNVKPLLYAEFQDSTRVSGKTFRIIRDREGFYYVTGPGFRNVYVFEHRPAGLAQTNMIRVHEQGLGRPAFNNRPPYIQLINGRDTPVFLNKYGVQRVDAGKGGS